MTTSEKSGLRCQTPAFDSSRLAERLATFPGPHCLPAYVMFGWRGTACRSLSNRTGNRRGFEKLEVKQPAGADERDCPSQEWNSLPPERTPQRVGSLVQRCRSRRGHIVGSFTQNLEGYRLCRGGRSEARNRVPEPDGRQKIEAQDMRREQRQE